MTVPASRTLGFPGIGDPGHSRSVRSSPGCSWRRMTAAHAPADGIADFSARGGEVAGPDIVTPGVAYSTVPLWNRGGEREGGTSMASPHAAGLAARLLSRLRSRTGSRRCAWTIRQALMVTAQPLTGATFVDEGTGLPNLRRAWAWLTRHPDDAVRGRQPRRAAPIGAFVEAAAERRCRSPASRSAAWAARRSRCASRPMPLDHCAASAVTLGDGLECADCDSALAARPARGLRRRRLGWGPERPGRPLVRLVTTIVVPYRDADIEPEAS